jgi:Sugar (and other) transporter
VISWGPVPWLLGAEIFPLRARAKGAALSIVSNWMSNFIVAFITPPLFNAISGGYYFVLVGFCIISGIFVYFVYPETAHVTLEQLSQVFNNIIVPDPESVRTLTALQLASGKMRPTTSSEVSDDNRLQLMHKNKSDDGSRASSSTLTEDNISLEPLKHVEHAM